MTTTLKGRRAFCSEVLRGTPCLPAAVDPFGSARQLGILSRRPSVARPFSPLTARNPETQEKNLVKTWWF